MMELTINNQVYQFIFGMGFLRKANETAKTDVAGINNKQQNIGLRYMIAGIMDGEVDTLVDVLDMANEGQSPRLTKSALDSYIDDPNTDIDELFETTMGFLETSNATKKYVEKLKKDVREAKEAKEAQKKQ